MKRWLFLPIASLILSLPVSAETENESSTTGSIVNYAELLRRQKGSAGSDSLMRANVELRAAYVMNRHEQAFARLRERLTDEQIECAFALIHSVRTGSHFFFWLSYSYFPETIAPQQRDFIFGEMQGDLGPEFVSGGPGHYAPNLEMMELTVALTNGRLGEFEMVDALPSGLSKNDAVKLGRARDHTQARELHQAALAKVTEQRSEKEIEAAYIALFNKRGDYALELWIRYCYLRDTPGLQWDRRISESTLIELGPEFTVEYDDHLEPNPAMVEYTLALTNGDLDRLRIVPELPSGKSGLEVFRAEVARRPRDLIFHIRALTRPLSRRDATAEPWDTHLHEINPQFNVVTFEAKTAADLARELRAWLRDNAGRVGMVVIEGDGLGTVTDLTSWSGRPALADALAPLRGRLAEDAQIVAVTTDATANAEAHAKSSRMLLEDLGVTSGSVFALTSRRRHIPPLLFARYLAGARVAVAGAVINASAALFGGVTDPNQIVFAGLGAPLLYLAARPLYAISKDGLAKDHRWDSVVALGAGVATLAVQTATGGNLTVVIPSLGAGYLAYLLGSTAQYLTDSAPRIWQAHRGRLNTGLRLNLDAKGGESSDRLRFDRDRLTLLKCESTLLPKSGASRANFAVVR